MIGAEKDIMGESEEEDMENDPRKAKLIEMGIDPMIVESEPELAMALAESMMA